MTEQRLTDLEIKISHQEDLIETLQALVYEQQKTVQKLEDQMQRLIDRITDLMTGDSGVNPAHEKPPHY